jgi:hypothetical protein
MTLTIKGNLQKYFLNINGNAGFITVKLIVAVILLTAALMKCVQLATTPDLGNGFLQARWINQIAVILELSLGIWLLSGLLQKTAWLVSLILFIGFAGISFYKAAILHETHCGCFGAAQVNPYFTMTLDLVIVGLLIIFRPAGMIFHWQTFFQEFFGLRLNQRFFAVVGIWLVVAVPITYAMFSVQKNEIVEFGTEFIGADGKKTILLEPEKWVGKEFPLLLFIEPVEIREKLKRGIWSVTLVRRDCEECQRFLKSHPTDFLVELFEKSHEINSPQNRDENGTQTALLKGESHWIVPTPCLIKIKNNICIATEK